MSYGTFESSGGASLYGGSPATGFDVASSVEAAIAYLQARWNDFLNLGPTIINAQHRAAELAYQLGQQGDTQRANQAKDVIAQLGRLNVYHGKVLDKIEAVRGWVGLGGHSGLGAIPAIQVSIITGLALLVVWIFRAYEAEERKLDLIEQGILTPEEAAGLDVGPAPDKILGGLGDIAKIVLIGLGLWVALEAMKTAKTFRPNPELMVFDTNPPEEFGEEVYAVYYRHAENGQNYVHDFGPGVEMIPNPDGTVTLAHSDAGRAVWEEFDVE